MKTQTKSAYEEFHKLWGKAKDSKDYDKKEWQSLYLKLQQIINVTPFKI